MTWQPEHGIPHPFLLPQFLFLCRSFILNCFTVLLRCFRSSVNVSWIILSLLITNQNTKEIYDLQAVLLSEVEFATGYTCTGWLFMDFLTYSTSHHTSKVCQHLFLNPTWKIFSHVRTLWLHLEVCLHHLQPDPLPCQEEFTAYVKENKLQEPSTNLLWCVRCMLPWHFKKNPWFLAPWKIPGLLNHHLHNTEPQPARINTLCNVLTVANSNPVLHVSTAPSYPSNTENSQP